MVKKLYTVTVVCAVFYISRQTAPSIISLQAIGINIYSTESTESHLQSWFRLGAHPAFMRALKAARAALRVYSHATQM